MGDGRWEIGGDCDRMSESVVCVFVCVCVCVCVCKIGRAHV